MGVFYSSTVIHPVYNLTQPTKIGTMPKRRHPELHALPAKRKPLPKQDPDRPSVNDLKKQIRNAKRLLARDDLPADSRIVQERALAGYERELGEETRRRHRSEMIGKYHFVRFLGTHSSLSRFAWLAS